MKKPLQTLATMLAVTTILVALTGTYLKAAVLESLQVYQDESVLAIPFLLMTDDAVKYMLKARANTEATEPQETEWEVQEEPETIPPKKEMPETEPVEIPTEPVEITEEWFDDALFIGDSRILGMRYQRRLGNADYFTQMSMSTFSAMYWQLSDARFFDKNLEYVLSNFEYKKILIHLGLNECGYDHELVISAYQDLIDMIRKYQPDAAIIVQSVMTVSRGKATDEQFTLERINNLNRLLRELADQNGLYYQDTNEFAADEEGYLRDDISNDGTHPHNFGYEEWIEFIMKDCARFGIA